MWVHWDTAPLVQTVEPCGTVDVSFAIHEGNARDALANLEGVNLHWALLLALREMRQATRPPLMKPSGEQPALIPLGPSKHLKLSNEPSVWPRVASFMYTTMLLQIFEGALREMRPATRLPLTRPIGEQPALISMGLSKHLELSLEPLGLAQGGVHLAHQDVTRARRVVPIQLPDDETDLVAGAGVSAALMV